MQWKANVSKEAGFNEDGKDISWSSEGQGENGKDAPRGVEDNHCSLCPLGPFQCFPVDSVCLSHSHTHVCRTTLASNRELWTLVLFCTVKKCICHKLWPENVVAG